MTEVQRTKTQQLLEDNATLEQLLSEPDIVSQSKWQTADSLKN